LTIVYVAWAEDCDCTVQKELDTSAILQNQKFKRCADLLWGLWLLSVVMHGSVLFAHPEITTDCRRATYQWSAFYFIFIFSCITPTYRWSLLC